MPSLPTMPPLPTPPRRAPERTFAVQRGIRALAVVAMAFGATLGAGEAAAQTRRALLIGISAYTAPATGAPVRPIRNLAGPVNDVAAMRGLLVARHGFDAADIREITNGAATRAAILAALDSLGHTAQPGDDVVVFYAGHGSQVRNEASTEADGLDETLVPADAPSGVPDVRDKELRVRFAAIAARGARLTVVVDACHSGSIARGVVLGATRYADPSTDAITDASIGPTPESMAGVLVLSAAQDVELAQEITPPGRSPVGAFTDALVAALAEAPEGEAVSVAFARARARMKALGIAQEPVLSGDLARRGAPLFGAPKATGEGEALVLPVSRVGRGVAEVEGGLAVGLTVGSRLRCTAVGASGDGVEVTVTAALGLGRSRVSVPDGARVAPGDACRVASLAPAADVALRLWTSAPLPSAERARLDGLDSLLKAIPRARRVRDPIATPPTHLVWWSGREWLLRRGGARPQAIRLDARGIRSACSDAGDCDLYAIGALAPDVRAALVAAVGALPVAFTADLADADYVLDTDGVRASWVRAAGGDGALVPQRTDAVVARRAPDASALADQAAGLARVWAWHRLASPASGADAFPYRLSAWEDTRTGARIAAGEPLRASSTYRAVFELPLALKAEATAGATYQARYVYLFAIDTHGNGDLLFPLDAFGGVENRIAGGVGAAPSFALPAGRAQYLFETGEAGSRDLLVVLTTEEPLPDPSVLSFRGVRTRRAAPAQTSPLARLLFGVGEAVTRSNGGTVPATWSVQRVELSVER